MRIVVIVLNVISTLASLAMVWFGWVMAGFALEFDRRHPDYYILAYSIVVMAAFTVIPVLCAVRSSRLARQGRRSSILLSLLPLALIVPAFLMYSAGGVRMLERSIDRLLAHP